MDRDWSDWPGHLRTSLSGLRDPARRHRRRRRRAHRALVFRSLLTVALAWVTSVVGAAPGVELGEVFWGTATGFAGLGLLAGVRRVWLLERSGKPPRPAAPAPLPPAGSAARAPLERLASRERALADLLALLGPPATDVAAEAAAAAATLREHAGRLLAVETARRGVPAEAAAGLDAVVATLRQRLEEGVSGYDRVVSAAADAVAASGGGQAGGPDRSALYRLEDAADTLVGLARGLREVAGTEGAAPA
ncbi:MAG TPA: hypothetical protein VFX70_03150 [Mycobacteriales bacterium]|nr:hypothetical protein [Mycobacteriales bacterium]